MRQPVLKRGQGNHMHDHSSSRFQRDHDIDDVTDVSLSLSLYGVLLTKSLTHNIYSVTPKTIVREVVRGDKHHAT